MYAGICLCEEVLNIGGIIYTDKTKLLHNKQFKVEYHGEGQGMSSGWMLVGPGRNRPTAGTRVSWKTSDENMIGIAAGEEICFQFNNQATRPRYFLEAFPNSRVVWRPSYYGISKTHMFKVFCDGDPLGSDFINTQTNAGGGRKARCQLVSRKLHDNSLLLRVFDVFLVWCKMADCWYQTPNSFWTFSYWTLWPIAGTKLRTHFGLNNWTEVADCCVIKLQTHFGHSYWTKVADCRYQTTS